MRRKTYQTKSAEHRGTRPSNKPAAAPHKRKRTFPPALPLFVVAIWAWGTFYYGSVLHVSREYSFWASDTGLMQYVLCQKLGMLRYVGRMLLQLYQYPWLGSLALSLMLGAITWLTGYCMRLTPRWRPVQYIPALAFLAAVTHQGLDIFFEAETGYIMGIPFVALLALAIWAAMTRGLCRKPMPAPLRRPQGESPGQNLAQLAFALLAIAAIMGYGQWKRPYVRVICQEMSMQYKQDWAGIGRVARAHAIQSNRPMAAYYAMALVHTGQIAERMYDIRLDYDSLYLHGYGGQTNNGVPLYEPEGNFHAGFIEPCMRSCMEQMVMTGPTPRLLKLLVKCSLMRGEWMLARKYLRILQSVPFEAAFVKKYEAMLDAPGKVNADSEMARLRLTEPIHDCFENQFQTPFFMGYNLNLVEARGMEALTHSLCVCLYTKLMPPFLSRVQFIKGSTPPEIIADGLLLAEMKHPGASQGYGNLDMRMARLQNFIQATQPYMKDRAGNAYKLFERYKGYYPYYYFFGNLKATKKGYTGEPKASAGVN
ncbi:MAG TPA: hypothetical protein DDW22_07510 [Prevotellaceae bacterium]|nr:hypothetical protein [Prevotellaceae bacterium]